VLGLVACLWLIAAIIIAIAVATHLRREQPPRPAEATASAPGTISRETLRGRLAAASVIYESEPKDKSLAAVAADAAKAGEVDLVKDALRQMYENSRRNQAAHESALLLAKRGLREQAIEIARTINENTIRDQTLSELAQ
jgi:protein-disulfide isomerase-like protein with CxxC motif